MKDKELRERVAQLELRLKSAEDALADWTARVRSAQGRFYRALRDDDAQNAKKEPENVRPAATGAYPAYPGAL